MALNFKRSAFLLGLIGLCPRKSCLSGKKFRTSHFRYVLGYRFYGIGALVGSNPNNVMQLLKVPDNTTWVFSEQLDHKSLMGEWIVFQKIALLDADQTQHIPAASNSHPTSLYFLELFRKIHILLASI